MSLREDRPMDWSGRGWTVAIVGGEAAISSGESQLVVDAVMARGVTVRRRRFRTSLVIRGVGVVRLRGAKRETARAVAAAFGHLALRPAVEAAVTWYKMAFGVLAERERDRSWITAEMMDALVSAKPQSGLALDLRVNGTLDWLSESERLAVDALDSDLGSAILAANRRIGEAELLGNGAFFAEIERSPLTEEQARAVVSFDNRVQVVAAAGSGKTALMVARAAYAVKRGLVPADRILLLAFNRDAAAELQERIEERFAAVGLSSDGVRASTFHAFGLRVIGEATGRKPQLAPWIERNNGVDELLRIVAELRDSDGTFRYRWDLYRLLFSRAPADLNAGDPDGYDKTSRRTGYETLGGEIVKSHGERLIADFLYLNGVRYEYERPYAFATADSTHGQYRPDFYYPDIDVWHEHWALGRDGRAPASFEGYAEQMTWKRALHARYGTTLIESTWADVMFGSGLSRLETTLRGLGLVLEWNPHRPPRSRWVNPPKDEDLARFMRTFMSHVKSNGWTPETITSRMAAAMPDRSGFRSELFLSIYWPVHHAWQQRLRAEGLVDYDDMIVEAADLLEAGRFESPFELVLVDEFQDVSRARARMLRGLLREPGRFLLAVGDDWQAINRFAGADVAVMAEFEQWFGRGLRLALTNSFRCPQRICDVARSFVLRNRAQFDKPMRSMRTEQESRVVVVLADDTKGALAAQLEVISAAVAEQANDVDRRRASVDVLGRYRFHQDLLGACPRNLDVTFRTVHGSKGLEADHIVIPGLDRGTYGFPSSIEDDPVLDLVMPRPEPFEHAEERRLLYVALTRARRRVVLIGSAQNPSPFVAELIEDPNVEVRTDTNERIDAQRCARCGQGTMVARHGRFGDFLGCSRFPACRHTSPV